MWALYCGVEGILHAVQYQQGLHGCANPFPCTALKPAKVWGAEGAVVVVMVELLSAAVGPLWNIASHPSRTITIQHAGRDQTFSAGEVCGFLDFQPQANHPFTRRALQAPSHTSTSPSPTHTHTHTRARARAPNLRRHIAPR